MLLKKLSMIPAGVALAFAALSTQAAPSVEMQTSMGTIVIELDGDKAPLTVKNFLQYTNDGFYNGTVFHRVIEGFMIQGGGFTKDMGEKPTGAQIPNEAKNGLKNQRGTIAMARRAEPHSATAQFFINIADNDFLNFKMPNANGWGYCVFGKVVEGSDVVDKIKGVKTGSSGFHQDVPKEDVIIERAEIC